MKNLSFMRNGKEFEPTKDELKRVLDDYAERLALTEKALEKCYEYHKKHSTPADWVYHISKEEYIKEMMESE